MRTIGLLGGMGPAAGADLYARIVAAHDGRRDQDHPPCILVSATQVPDRSAFLFGDGPDPAPALAAAACTLEAAGADFIAMPCNTAHAFLGAIRAAVGVPVLDMIELAAAAALEAVLDESGAPAPGGNGAGVARVVAGPVAVGLLAADGTVRAALYDAPLERRGMAALYPDAAGQERVMAAIRDVKSGSRGRAGAATTSDARLVAAADALRDRGAACLLMGCTEVPLALHPADAEIPTVDANQVLAETVLALGAGRMDFKEIAFALA